MDKKDIRTFESGATRDVNYNKLDYEGFDSPLVNKRYAEYMHSHRKQADGSLRAADNWQKGIPKQAYMESLVRHVEDAKLHWDGYPDEAVDPDFENVLCAILFNAKGLLYELIHDRRLAKIVEKTLTQDPYDPQQAIADARSHILRNQETGPVYVPNYGKFKGGLR